MGDDETLSLAPDPHVARAAAEALFATMTAELASMLPGQPVILHVGATAIPGCLTKGDLDILVRVDRADFAACETLLAKRFTPNAGSIRTAEFAAFEDAEASPHLGIQLAVRGGAFDVFHLFAEKLRQDPALVRRYNALKRRYEGKAMPAYRAAKDAFVVEVIGDKRRRS